MAGADLEAVGERIGSLLAELQSSAPGPVWGRIEELVQLLTDLYGAGLERALELAAGHPELVARLGRDELVGSLLVLHDLHPEGLAQRVAGALDAVDAPLGKGGASAQVTHLDAEAAAVLVTVTAPGGASGSTAETLRDLVATAVNGAAPDADVTVRVETDPAGSSTPVRLVRKPAGAVGGR